MEPLTLDRATKSLTLGDQLADGLHALADAVRANPGLAVQLEYSLATTGLNAHLNSRVDVKEEAASFIHTMKQATSQPVTFDTDDTFRNAVGHFGAVKVKLLTYRTEVCERVVTGTETVTKKVKDPEALAAVPEIEVTEEVERVEWRCGSLLAGAAETR